MAIYTIIRVYEVPAETGYRQPRGCLRRYATILSAISTSRITSGNRVREPGKGKPVDLRPMGWLSLIREQLGLVKKPAPVRK